jgi:hypothetical protein
MRAARMGIAVLAAFGLASCTTWQDYPRCYLFQAPADADVAAQDKQQGLLLGGIVGAGNYHLGKDWVAVDALPSQHRRFVRIWPPLGCINLRNPPPEVAAIGDKWTVARCQEYLRALIQDGWTRDTPKPTVVAKEYGEFTCH